MKYFLSLILAVCCLSLLSDEASGRNSERSERGRGRSGGFMRRGGGDFMEQFKKKGEKDYMQRETHILKRFT